jgi:glycosyltransferase involved in cell wall biosynthesis
VATRSIGVTVKICFILPGSSPTPTGGVKNIYEHANRLAARGHRVTILHAAYVTRRSGVRSVGRAAASYLLNRLGVMQWRPDQWFRIDPRVDMRWAPSPSACRVPDGDAVVATAWQTAEWVREYPPTKGEKFYFAMDFERYMEAGPELRGRISATHTAGLRTMVISPAGREMVEAGGGRISCFVPCALEFSIYRLQNGIDSDLRTMIGFPTRPERHKSTEDAIKALELVRSGTSFGGTVWSFGGERPADFPEWANYHTRPSDSELARLYNLTSIFVVPSRYEGWGLPGSEAMACGAALVSTDNGGVRAYAEHDRTALLTPAGDPEALAAAVRSLLRDNELRTRLASAGFEHIQQFTWDRASDDLERCLSGKD